MTRAFCRRDAAAEPHGWDYASLDLGGTSPPNRKLNSYNNITKSALQKHLLPGHLLLNQHFLWQTNLVIIIMCFGRKLLAHLEAIV